MSAIFYVLRKSIKNTFLEMLHHPLKLVLYVFVAAMLIFAAVVNMGDPDPRSAVKDIRMLEGIYLAVLIIVAVPSLLSGMNSGASFFKMSDVSMLFVSPISSKKILAYGLVKQMGTNLLVAFFMLSYGGMAVNFFRITPAQGIYLLLGFAAMTFIMQLLTMLIYSYVNGNEKRIKTVKYGLYALMGAVLLFVGLQIRSAGVSEESILAAVSAPQLEYIPFVGWVKGMLFGIIKGNTAHVAVYALLTVLGVGLNVILFLRSDADYYEDVLQNTESTYEMKQSVKEGRAINMNMGAFAKKSFKVRDTGLNGGWGASAFFYKQMREIKRRSRLVFVGGSTLTLLAACVFIGFIMNSVKDDGEVISSNISMMACTMMCVYVLFFLNAAGEWTRELMKPYLYMVPEDPFKKLIWASLTSLIKPAVDGLLVFTVAGILLKASPFTSIICILIYTSFGFLFTSSNLLSQRVLGQMANKGLIMVLYMTLLMVILAPGIAIGVIMAVCIPTMPKVLMGVPVFVWNTAVSAGIYMLCKNTLHDMEIM